MPNWLPLILVAVILLGIIPILNNKSVQIHGPIANLFIVSVMAIILSGTLFLFKRDAFRLTTAKSLGITIVAAIFSFVVAISIFYAYKGAPNDLSLITITISFHIVLVAIINHFLGSKMQFHQWIGAVIAFLGMVLVSLKK